MRWHRALLYRWLQTSGLYDDGLISFHGVGADNTKGAEIDLESPPPTIVEHFPELLAGISNWIPRKPQRFDNREAFGNDLVLTLELEAYTRTRFSIVAETDFFHGDVERMTEKALKAISVGHPLIVLGAPRTLSFLRQLGFSTFDGQIDQSYDMIEDPVERMREVFAVIARTHDLAKSTPGLWRRSALEEAEANFAHARGGLLARMDRVISRPVLQRMGRFVETGWLD